jgi:hypothetical protein
MTSHQSRRTALTLTALLLAGMTLGAPMALAANPLHAPPRCFVWLHVQPHGTVRAMVPHAPAVQPHTDDPFASLHFE